MDDRVLLKIYYHGHILLQTAEGVKFVCENPLDIVIPFTLSFEELKGIICEKMDSQICRRISCILYRNPISVFGGFVQFQTKYVTDEASMQDMFSVYMETRSRISFIELYIEFEQSEADRNIEMENYNSDSEEEFESNYECLDPGGDGDQADDTMQADVADVANALVNQHPFVEPTFMRSLDLEAVHTLEFPEYMNAELPVVADGEFIVGMEFSSREAVIKVMKDYTIRRGMDYRYGAGCDWLIRVSKMSKKYCWEIRRYNGSHTCTRATISQDHSKLGSDIIAEAIKPLAYRVELPKKVQGSIPAEAYRQHRIFEDGLRRTSGNIQVSCFDRQNEVFEVREMPSGVEYAVNLRRRVCDCGEFQVDRISCRHVFAYCANQRLDWQMYVHEVYKMDQIQRVYRARFRPLGNPTTWPVYTGPRFVGNPFLRRVAKGRPKMTRFLNEMDTRMLRAPRRCKQCGAEGHSRSRCRQRGGASADPAT
ncbi:hypothetical protein Ahy_B07g086583 [Arachis hypogaea]|uniref:SWIM-type domain-containing protein n=1 Tax=Arachis hypogaea TaxID=3818 RepID=A0A444YAC5_ARAHY|nr:hypothetical protein Ahy_B07g086583 [Arachis hypogaea]